MHPIQRFFRLLQLDKKDITYIYLYAIFARLIALSLLLGVQAIIVFQLLGLPVLSFYHPIFLLFGLLLVAILSLRTHTGDRISQEDIFKSSVLENITMDHQNFQFEDVIRAVQRVGLSDFVKNCPRTTTPYLLPGGKNRKGTHFENVFK